MCVAHGTGTGDASRTVPEGFPKKWRTGNDTKEAARQCNAHRNSLRNYLLLINSSIIYLMASGLLGRGAFAGSRFPLGATILYVG